MPRQILRGRLLGCLSSIGISGFSPGEEIKFEEQATSLQPKLATTKDTSACAAIQKRKRRVRLLKAIVIMMGCWRMLNLVERNKRVFGYVPRDIVVSNAFRQHVSFEAITASYKETAFKGAFRLTRKTFYKLLAHLLPKLTRNEEMGRRSGRTVISPAIRLAITLRMLAGACVHDLIPLYKAEKATVYQVFHSTISAINELLTLPGLPSSLPELRESAEQFTMSRSPPSPLSGCVGALDGIAVKIKKPHAELNPAQYYCRKQFYAIPVQALVDYKYRFLCYSARCVGSTHDSLAHAVSRLGRYLERGLLRGEFWIAGDEAYICTEYLITPFPSSSITDWQDSFNFWHSSLRMHVEQAFGMLMAKFRMIADLRFSVDVCTVVICVAMKLHNFIIDEQGPMLSTGRNGEITHSVLVQSEEWYASAKALMLEISDGPRQGVSRKRDELLSIVKERGMTRPAIAEHS